MMGGVEAGALKGSKLAEYLFEKGFTGGTGKDRKKATGMKQRFPFTIHLLFLLQIYSVFVLTEPELPQ